MDDISVFRKMLTCATPGEPVIMLIVAGNLATTLAATSCRANARNPHPGHKPSLLAAPSMVPVARAGDDTLRDMKTTPQDRSPT